MLLNQQPTLCLRFKLIMHDYMMNILNDNITHFYFLKHTSISLHSTVSSNMGTFTCTP